MLIKGEDADNIVLGDTLHPATATATADPDKKFDYMLANPPFGVEWKQQQEYIAQEAESIGLQAAASAPACRASTTARCCSCST
jgi:type I restriction enzyme M protein